uniref:Uncharacterized protein n=1 Tax=Wuchereria bancrofti TaxID=6293 RepID=A0AAF5Q5H8_WUCBA
MCSFEVGIFSVVIQFLDSLNGLCLFDSLMEVLTSLKQRHSNCVPQQKIIQKKGIIAHNTLEDYYFFLDKGLRGTLIALIAIAIFIKSRIKSNFKNKKFICQNFMKSFN